MSINDNLQETTEAIAPPSTIEESMKLFVSNVAELYPKPGIPIPQENYETYLITSEFGLLKFLCSKRIGFDEIITSHLWEWRDFLKEKIKNGEQYSSYLIAARAFFIFSKDKLNPDLSADLDLIPRPLNKDVSEQDWADYNPLYVYFDEILD